MANLVKFLSGTKAAYKALGTSADVSTLYFIDDTHELYKGTMPIGNNHVSGTAGSIVAVGAEGQGLSASPYNVVTVIPAGADESKIVPTVALVTEMIGDITSGAVTGVSTIGDSYITISGGKTADTSQIIEIKVSANTGDVANTSLATGLVADAKNVHDYIDTVSGNLNVTFETASTVTAGYLKTYNIKKGNNVIGTIDIPKDFVVKSASVKVCEVKDEPIEGLNVGDKYLDLAINVMEGSAADEHVYLAAKDLGADYGEGDHIKIAAGEDGKTKISVSGITTDGTGVTSASTDLTEGKAVYEFVNSKIITSVTLTGNDYIGVDTNLNGQNLALTAMPIVASASGEIATATSETHKLASDNAVKEYVDAKTQAHNAYTTITVAGESGTYTQSASTSASTATIEFVGTSNIAEAGVTGNFIDVNVNSDDKVETVITVATSSATVEGTTYTTNNDTLISAKAVQELMTWGEIPEPTE